VNAFDVAEAEGRCECGEPLATHPPLPRPKPMSEGRPCSRELRAADGFGTRSGGSWGHGLEYASPKAHRPSAAQQPVIVSRAAQGVR
jgi:hypothetical protein